MMHLRKIYPLCSLLIILVVLGSCTIKDDLPLPIKKAMITAFEVEGQCNETDNGYAEAVIDKNNRTVDVYIGDTVNLAALSIKRFEVSNEATIIPEQDICIYPNQFPSTSFTRSGADVSSKVNFSKGSVGFTLRTYQDYEWTVNVRQLIQREVSIVGQVSEAIIDPANQNVIVYVSSTKNLKQLQVQKFSLGGQHGIVSPDPTTQETYDFSQMRTFQVTLAGSHETQSWKVFVYKKDVKTGVEATAFARSVSATISGTIPMNSQPVVEYHPEGTTGWNTVNPAQVTANGTRFSAELTGLLPGAIYTYRVTADLARSEEKTFTTVAEQQLENSGFDKWSTILASSGKDLYQPWGEGEQCFWDTGNRGATTVGASNSTYKDEDGRRFANLQSKFIVLKFAAGNIFTGQYIETYGTNGILSFGRPFTSFPTKMRFDYKYHTSPINRTGGNWDEVYSDYINREVYEGLKGQPDSCNIYIALGDWEPQTYKGVECPVFICTRPRDLHLFNINDPHLIAFAQMTKGENVNTWTTETITLNYRVKDRQPKYVIVVASSSKYGDFFTGSEESLLQLDNLELLYE